MMTGTTTWRELLSQPDAWERLVARLDGGAAGADVMAEGHDEILMLGSGTSYYLALAAADWVRRRHPIDVRAVPSCEIMLDASQRMLAPGRRRLVIGISRSGESSELLFAIEALKGPGTTVLGISCVEGSALLRMADRPLFIAEGQEDGLVMLRSFTSMLITLHYMFGSEADRAGLRGLAQAGRASLANDADAVRALARRRRFDRFVYLASGASYPIALEASLKVQEMSIATSEAYHSLEYRHGPKACADENTLLTLFALSDIDLGLSLARDMKALGVTLLVVGPGADDYGGIADLTVATPPKLDEGAASPISLLPLQLLAFETAMQRGKNPDAPENLSKVVILEPALG